MPDSQISRAAKARWIRRLVQAIFLVTFLVLFRLTDYRGSDEISGAVNIFFRWDPLASASAMLSARAFIALMLPAAAVILLTIVLGRFFCGWVCPLGTCLDVSHKIVRPRGEPGRKYRNVKYFLLAVVLISAIAGVELVGYLDPFSILVRGLTLSVDPALNIAVTAPFDLLYRHAPEWVTAVSEPVYAFLKGTLLPFQNPVYGFSLVSGVILLAVFALEKIGRRFWCRNLCPLGAMLGLVSRLTPLRMKPGKACKSKGCTTCIDICRMGAIDEEGLVSPEACNLCLDCMVECPKGIISFDFSRPPHDPAPLGISRRSFAAMFATGLALPAFLRTGISGKKRNPYLIRPPGAKPEGDFLPRCVRCGECMKVCINNALHPALADAGVEGIFTPVLIPRVGYCEYNCTLCGQVCPSGAIEKLKVDDKHQVIIARAFIDKNRCLPWAKGEPCIVCEEMCPIPDKAIKLEEATVVDRNGQQVAVQRPIIVDERCNGCGMCENKCPVAGRAAVIVTSEGESRTPAY